MTRLIDAVILVLRYLKQHYIPSNNNLKLIAYYDADWVSRIDTTKFFTGYCFVLRSTLISWKTKKQITVSISSIEAEYKSMAY